MSEDDPTPTGPATDPTAEGSRARAEGKPRDACPYPLGSEQAHEWSEGYDGQESQGSPLVKVKN